MLTVVGYSSGVGHCAEGPGEYGWVDHLKYGLMADGDEDWRHIKDVVNLSESGALLADQLPAIEGYLAGYRETHRTGTIEMLAQVGGRESIAEVSEDGEYIYKYSVDEFSLSVSQLLAICQQRRVRLGFVSNHPLPEERSRERGGKLYKFGDAAFRAYQQPVQELSLERGIPYIDIYAVLENCPEPTLAPDDMHPNGLGHRLIAETVAPYVRPSVRPADFKDRLVVP